jgi:DNA-directed RNA polymerase subunit RPC12/RpoP
MFTDTLQIMRDAAAARAERLARLTEGNRRCSACGRTFPADGGYIFRWTQDRERVHVRRICEDCGSRLARMMGNEE